MGDKEKGDKERMRNMCFNNVNDKLEILGKQPFHLRRQGKGEYRDEKTHFKPTPES